LRGPLASNARRRVARRARRRRVWLFHSAPEGREHWTRNPHDEASDLQPRCGKPWASRPGFTSHRR
ncbi:MAG: hypothetical protein O2946_02300, partial [Planctomycetota bacterium]|nr:hypothetical protein [Planctomycetota bacterium]